MRLDARATRTPTRRRREAGWTARPRWAKMASSDGLPGLRTRVDRLIPPAWPPPSPCSARAPRPSSPGRPMPTCLVTRVVHGDSFYCGDGRKVRLIDIDSPERGQGAAGLEARRALGRLTGEA